MKRERGRRPRRKVCSFCVDKVEEIDYKDANKLKRYITERGRFYRAVFPVPALSTNAN